MKKLLLCALLSLTSILPTLAKDLVLTFKPEYCDNQQIFPASTAPISIEINGYIWALSNFWHTDENMTSVQCGKKSSSEIQSTIKMPNQTIDIAVSEVIIRIDEDSYLEKINSITLETQEFSGTPKEIITKNYGEISTGDLSFEIQNPQRDLHYIITVKSHTADSTPAGYLQISKVVYKELVEKKTPELAWSKNEVTATIGDDKFEAPTLRCAPDDDEVKGLIKYASSNETVAKINDDGELTLVGPGETTISASIEGNDAVAATSASYKLIVEAEPNTLLLVFNSVTLPTVDQGAESWKVETSDGIWSMTNLSVNENGYGITFGQNGTTASILTDFFINEHLKEIVLTVDDLKEGEIDNITLYTYGHVEPSGPLYPIESITVEQPQTENIVFDVTAQPDLKYNIVINSNASDAAGAINISRIVYRKATDVEEASPATLFVSENDSPNANFVKWESGTYKSNDNWVVIKFDEPENHSVWHRFVGAKGIIAPVATSRSFMSRATADEDRHGFNQYSGQSFKHIDNGALEFYTENADGTRSAMNRVEFSGVTSVDEIDCDDNQQPAEFYNLQGIKIDRPSAAGIYIVRRGSKTEKVSISRGDAAL